jgi:hypothetical protein
MVSSITVAYTIACNPALDDVCLSLHSEGVAMDQGEMHQLMLERQQRLEDALIRAEDGTAQEEDWQIIYFECGLRRIKNVDRT